MSLTTYTLIPRTVCGTPSGNYDGSSQDFDGDPQRAANYYNGQGISQTIDFSVTDFQGVFIVQATLDTSAENTNWVDIYEWGDMSTTMTDHFPAVIPGKFTWIRVKVLYFNFGTINAVNINY
jgi:hypothetical protein